MFYLTQQGGSIGPTMNYGSIGKSSFMWINLKINLKNQGHIPNKDSILITIQKTKNIMHMINYLKLWII